MAVKIQSRSSGCVAVGYQYFGGPLAASIFTLKMEAARFSKVLISYHNTTWYHNPENFNLNVSFSIS
jgi:hypothetical protein